MEHSQLKQSVLNMEKVPMASLDGLNKDQHDLVTALAKKKKKKSPHMLSRLLKPSCNQYQLITTNNNILSDEMNKTFPWKHY